MKFDNVKKENDRLRKEITETYSLCDKKIENANKEVENRIAEVKEREKISYRDHIAQLEQKIITLETELEETKQRISPEREVKFR